MSKVQIVSNSSYKIGVDEIVGLSEAIKSVLKPVQDLIKSKIYWNDCQLEPTEYKSRDGFSAYASNCGGVELEVIIPKCEEYEFCFLKFGEHDDDCDTNKPDSYGDCTCGESEGHLDAKLRIWLKFEGYDSKTGELSFYLYSGGGNGDAPYFRSSAETDLFEASFTCKSVAGLKRAASKHVKALLEILK